MAKSGGGGGGIKSDLRSARRQAKKDLPVNEEFKEFAETAMNELLGWYGYSNQRPDARPSSYKSNSNSNSSGPVSPTCSHDCSWCNKPVDESTVIVSGSANFCSDLCFSQSRRASFKKSKTCDWCRHVRHTVSYVDFQDGESQLQFCSDKCLNQYKMQVFCREAQAHLALYQQQPVASTSRAPSSTQLEATASSSSASTVLITPDLWLRDCKSPDPEDDIDIVDDDSEDTTSLPRRKSTESTSSTPRTNNTPEIAPPLRTPLITLTPTAKLLASPPLNRVPQLDQNHVESMPVVNSLSSGIVVARKSSMRKVKAPPPSAPPSEPPSQSEIGGSSSPIQTAVGRQTRRKNRMLGQQRVIKTVADIAPTSNNRLQPSTAMDSDEAQDLRIHTRTPQPCAHAPPEELYYRLQAQNHRLNTVIPPSSVPFRPTHPPMSLPPNAIPAGVTSHPPSQSTPNPFWNKITPPPVTVLVPYPIMVPVPVPIPIPLPITSFLKAYGLRTDSRPAEDAKRPEVVTEPVETTHFDVKDKDVAMEEKVVPVKIATTKRPKRVLSPSENTSQSVGASSTSSSSGARVKVVLKKPKVL